MKHFPSKTILIILLTTLFSGCLYQDLSIKSEPNTNFTNVTSTLTSKLVKNFQKKTIRESIIIGDFVNMNSNTNNSSLGFILSSNLKSELLIKDLFDIKEINLSKNISLNKNGVNMISRDIDKIKTKKLNINYILVGQYQITSSQVIIYCSIIDIETSKIKAAATTSIKLTNEMKSVIYDLL